MLEQGWWTLQDVQNHLWNLIGCQNNCCWHQIQILGRFLSVLADDDQLALDVVLMMVVDIELQVMFAELGDSPHEWK